MMDGIDLAAQRDTAGRWLPGRSGNPRGKKPGTRNRATRLVEALGEGEAETILRIVVEQALEGDGVAARFCLSRLFAAPRGRAIRLDLPPAARPGDAVAAFNATLAALAAGEVTPEEALQVARFLEGRMKVLEAWEKERHLTWHGDPIPGDEASLAAQAPDASPATPEEPSPACSRRSEASPVAAAEAFGFRGSGGGPGGGSRPLSSAARASSDIPHRDPPPQAGEEEAAEEAEDRRSPEIEAQIAEFRKEPKQHLQFACIAALKEGKTRPEAIRYLARRLDIPLPPDLDVPPHAP